jgi:hypothetical protein
VALVRETAARALADRSDAAATAADLRSARRHPFMRVRCRALRALTRLAAHAPDLARVLAEALADSHWRVRKMAAELLSTLGAAALPALPALLRRRYDREQKIRDAANAALKQLRSAVHATLPDWIRVMTEDRHPALMLLAALNHPDFPEALRREFMEVCGRRKRWYDRLAGRTKVPVTHADPTVGAAWDALAAAEAAARAHASAAEDFEDLHDFGCRSPRAREAAWLMAWLCERLFAGQGPEDTADSSTAP